MDDACMALYSEAQQQRGSLSFRSIRWLRNCQGKRGLSFRPPPSPYVNELFTDVQWQSFSSIRTRKSQENSMTQ
jgi:hypothetical protein